VPTVLLVCAEEAGIATPEEDDSVGVACGVPGSDDAAATAAISAAAILISGPFSRNAWLVLSLAALSPISYHISSWPAPCSVPPSSLPGRRP